MSQFIQLHLLTSYPPANLNRDDLGRPKTAQMGGFERLRISSQSLKRHWRISDLFQDALAGHLGFRTKRFGFQVYQRLLNGGVKEKQAAEWASNIAGVFGKKKKEDPLEIEQLAHISPAEQDATLALVDTLIAENRAATEEELSLLSKAKMAVDIAMFGRMLAGSPAYGVEAACQVAHAISVHAVTVENDYFTAVDDLNNGKTDTGSSHIGETGFAAALFYSYICINKSLLIENLAGNEALANRAIAALTEAAVKIAPSGKQNSFGSRAYASYVLAEKGEYQPRSLSAAFLKPIDDEDQATKAIEKLEEQRKNFDHVYGACTDSHYRINAVTGEGRFAELVQFITA
ncbi:type I-E CRISPR-associated protein Cas7/Cse4/CasC [Xenorhabdus sp. DI]|uniref:type I-E CRISPR-associated protein Cas7/Cse4/CasC n=1 Tax=Xenorhabdus doucetiae TaxID=351671 RepID=UPI0019A316F0|nr:MULTISPECIES: type I-E CRISPR-associated protein Cas7/Cse4/CasC [unclassified Xenorhabdus]MBD2783306.1 type I-E CRISPR-associated protein Cas7/Cse4/CasC [Xenorhabdus sp. 3]MBD2788009.1 type I-E CRISPR-associated protein Cas7/Cse4/CasC [Xenorhabdus sp. DI]